MRRIRPTRLLAALTLLTLLLAPSGPAAAEEKVPRVTNDRLPMAGTGAPMARQNVTHVMVGHLGYYKIAGMGDQVITRRQLRALLQQRAGTQRPSPHEVWITADKDAIWAHVYIVRLVCSEVGLYRVGLRVRHDSQPNILGFPLFLPAGKERARPGRASRLPVVVRSEAEGPSSDPRILYQAAKAAREKFKQDVVAEIRIHNEVPIQTVLTSLDALHRGGCIGVNIKSLRNVATTAAAPHVSILIKRHSGKRDSLLPDKPVSPIVIPPVAPRTSPWPLHGANQPGALTMELEELPLPGGKRPRVVEDPTKPLPFYLRKGGVPADELRLADSRIRGWGRYLGEELLAGVAKRDGRVAQQFVVRLRDIRKLSPVMTPVSRAYAGATRIAMRSVRVDAVLFDGGLPIRLVEVDLLVNGDRVLVINAKPVPGQIPGNVRLMPEAVDPYAPGTPGRLRIWVEALLDGVRKRGAAAMTLAPVQRVLAACPQGRQAALQRALATRQSDVARFVQAVASVKFDRAHVSIRDATATVVTRSGAAGLIDLGIEAEEGQLRVNKMSVGR